MANGTDIGGYFGAVVGGATGVMNAFRDIPMATTYTHYGDWGQWFDSQSLTTQIGLGVQAATSFVGIVQGMQGVMNGNPMSIVMGILNGFGLYSSLMMMGVNLTITLAIIAAAVVLGILMAIWGTKKKDRAPTPQEQELTRAADEITPVYATGPVLMLAGAATMSMILLSSPDMTNSSQSISTPVTWARASVDRHALEAAIKQDTGRTLTDATRYGTPLVSQGTGRDGADQVVILSPDMNHPNNDIATVYSLKKNLRFTNKPGTNPTGYLTLMNPDGTINQNAVEAINAGTTLAAVGADAGVPTDLAYRSTRVSGTLAHPVSQ